MSDKRLAYGYNAGLPEGTETAWGARLIWPDDLVYDRQDSFGDFAALKPWLDWALKPALEEARRLAQSGELNSGMAQEVTLYEDDDGVILGDPQGSCGYLYICAYKPDRGCKFCGETHASVPADLCAPARREYDDVERFMTQIGL